MARVADMGYADGNDAWYDETMNYRNMDKLTNKSGASVTTGDVVVVDTTADKGFDTTETEGATTVIGVVAEAISGGDGATQTIADDAAGWIQLLGHHRSVKVTGATTRGQYLKASTTTGKATPVTGQQRGVFALALTAAAGVGTVEAYVFPVQVSPSIFITLFAGGTQADIETASVTTGTWDELGGGTGEEAEIRQDIDCARLPGTNAILHIVAKTGEGTCDVRLYNNTDTTGYTAKTAIGTSWTKGKTAAFTLPTTGVKEVTVQGKMDTQTGANKVYVAKAILEVY